MKEENPRYGGRKRGNCYAQIQREKNKKGKSTVYKEGDKAIRIAEQKKNKNRRERERDRVER